MAFENKEGCGALFPNKKQNDRQPDFRGDAMFEGRPIKIAGWWKPTKNGEEFLSLKVEAKQDMPRQSDAPGYDGPPRGQAQVNRDARQQQRRPAQGPPPAEEMFPTADDSNARWD